MLFCSLLAASLVGETANVAVFPARIELQGPMRKQRVLVEALANGGPVGEVAGPVEWTSSNPQTAVVEGGFVVARSDGTATLQARTARGVAQAEVVVKGFAQGEGWSFRNHVQSILTKQGCNSGACHGAIAGKNGLRLSLRGFDADADYDALVRQVRGRRLDVDRPGASLMLMKPSARVTHGGGKRLDEASPEFAAIAEWIAAGAPPPRAEDRAIVGLEVLPGDLRLTLGSKQRLVVRARFSDGRTEDVTRWAKYTSTNAEVVQIDDAGLATTVGRGEGAVTAWYLNKLAMVRIACPFGDGSKFDYGVERNFVDARIDEKLRALGVPASPLCSDAEFIRRASLDAAGVLPTADEVRAFLKDERPDKRARLIDAVLARPEAVDYWAYRWSDLLLVNSEKLRPPAMWAYYRWIRGKVAENAPWDVLVRELLTVQGSTLQAGAANFFALHPEPTELAETISTAFMGMSMNCCRCHNHPLEKWTNDEYYGYLNLVSRVKRKSGSADGESWIYVGETGDLAQPRSGRFLPPRPLDAAALDPTDARDRRHALADWLTNPANPYFTRAIVNRVWANYMGVGLVEKVDDLRLTNPASNEKLLAELSAYLVENKYDLRTLMRLVMQSAAYQRSSAPLPGNVADRRFYSRYYPKRLMAEVMLDGMSQTLAAPSKFPGYPDGLRALQLPDSNVASAFLQKFGRPDRIITCDCERNSEPSMVQVLHLSNGDVLNAKLSQTNNRLSKWLAPNVAADAVAEELYLSALARLPRPDERRAVADALKPTAAPARRQALEDVVWGVLSSKEFLFNR